MPRAPVYFTNRLTSQTITATYLTQWWFVSTTLLSVIFLVQGDPRSLILVPIESANATSY